MLMLYLSYFSEAHPEGITISNYKKNQETPTPKAITGFIQNFTTFYIGYLAPVRLIDAKAYV